MRCEICEKETINIKKHHIQSKSLGGSDKPYNIAQLCSECHDNVHNGLIIIEGHFTALNRDKPIILIWRYFYEKSFTGLSDPEVWLKPNHEKIKESYLLKQNKKIENNTEKSKEEPKIINSVDALF